MPSKRTELAPITRPVQHGERYVAGCQYWNAYWQESYTVLDSETDSGVQWVSVLWHGDGNECYPSQPRITRHCTHLEPGRDLVYTVRQETPEMCPRA